MEVQVDLRGTVEELLEVKYANMATHCDPMASESPRVLSRELIRLSGDLATYNRAYADVLKAFRTTKRRKNRVESDRAAWHREHADKPPSGRITDAYIAALAETDPKVIEVQDELDELEDWKTQLSGVVDAIRAKQKDLEAVGYIMQAEIRAAHLQGGGDEQTRETRAGIR